MTGTPVVPTLMGWGVLPDDHELNAGMVGLQTSHRYGNATFLESDFVLGIGNRWANRHTGKLDVYTAGRKFVHVDIEPTQIGKIFAPDYGIASDAKAALELFVEVARELKAAGQAARPLRRGPPPHRSSKATLQRRTHFDDIPIKPQRVYEEMNKAFGPETRYVSTIGLSQIAGAQMLHVYKPRHWINCGQAGPLGWTIPAALGVAKADPEAQVVALSGDYDFQFMIEELAVGAQHRIPYVHVLVNNAYLGLIRQAQIGLDINFQVNLEFENINSPELGVYGVDHVKVAEGLGCKAIRVTDPTELGAAFEQAKKLAAGVPGPGRRRGDPGARHQHLDEHDERHQRVMEFEEIATEPGHAPTSIRPAEGLTRGRHSKGAAHREDGPPLCLRGAKRRRRPAAATGRPWRADRVQTRLPPVPAGLVRSLWPVQRLI